MNREKIKTLKEKYSPGTKVVLHRMDDIQAPNPGTKGEVRCVDDMGTIHILWENGSSLGLIEGEDDFSVIQ